jgi:hypothetical protein
MDEVQELPRHHNSQLAIFYGGPELELVVDGDRGRHHLTVPSSSRLGSPDDVARRMISIIVDHRATGHIDEPDRWIEVLNAAGIQLARIDDSDSWAFRFDSLERLCALAGIDSAHEHYETEAEFLAARPAMTPAHIELEVEHPIEADVRDFGMALWYGTIFAILLGSASGMQFIFGTPVKYAVLTLAAAGLVIGTTISLWARIRWRRKRLDR